MKVPKSLGRNEVMKTAKRKQVGRSYPASAGPGETCLNGCGCEIDKTGMGPSCDSEERRAEIEAFKNRSADHAKTQAT